MFAQARRIREGTMKDKKKMIVAIVLIVAAVALFIIGMIILPDTIVMQMLKSGTDTTTMSKLVGLLIPLVLTTVFPVLYYLKGKPKDLVVSIVGLAIFGFIFFFNR